MPAKLLVQVERPAARPGAETWQLIVPYGHWDHPQYGSVDNTPERIQRYYEHFKAGIKLQGDPADDVADVLPFTIDHDDGNPASGWIQDVRISDKGLEALTRWTRAGVNAIVDEAYPFVSPDLVDRYTDPQSGQVYEDVLAGASLVVRPYFKNMPQVYLEHYTENPEPTVLWVDPEDPQMADDKVRTPPERPHAAPAETAAEAAQNPSAAAPAAPLTPQLPHRGEGEETLGEGGGPSTGPSTSSGQGSGQAVDTRQFREMQERVATMEFAERVRQYSNALGAHSFGERRLLAPGPKSGIAKALAKVPAHLAAELMEAIKAMRFYEPGEVGADLRGGRNADETHQFSEVEADVASQLGLAAEEFVRE